MTRGWTIVSVLAAFGVGLLAAMAAQPGGDGTRGHSAPVSQHAELVKLAGDYTTSAVLSMGGTEVGDSTGTAKVAAILDGRFIAIEETGETLGMAFKSHKLWGYNGGSRKYEAAWAYTGSTALVTLSGTSTDGGKTVTLEGGFDGEHGREKVRVTFARPAEGKFVVTEVALAVDGSEGATLETTYTKK